MQDTIETAAQSAEDVRILSELNAHYVRSVEECDVQWFEDHLAADFMNSNPDGSLVDRRGFLAQIAAGGGLSNIVAHDVVIRTIDDLGIIHARTTLTLPSGDAGAARYTDVWSKHDGRWLCVAAQVTRC